MRTHGVGLPSEDQLSSESSCPVPYIVGFEAPVVISSPEVDLLRDSQQPLKLRWVPPSAAGPGLGLFGASSSSSMSSSLSSSPGASASSGTGFTSGSSSSAGSSRARSLSGAGGAGADVVMMNGDVQGGRRALPVNGIHLFRSMSDDWETTPTMTTASSSSWSESPPSGPASPDSCGELEVCRMNDDEEEDGEEDDSDDFFKSVRNHRRVESERCGSFFFCYFVDGF